MTHFDHSAEEMINISSGKPQELHPKIQTSLKRVNLDKKNPKSNSLTIARHLPDEIRKLLVIKEANLERGNQLAIVCRTLESRLDI